MLRKFFQIAAFSIAVVALASCGGGKKTRKNKCNTCPSWKSELVILKDAKRV
ncbi:MAG: hypothetical protein ACK4K0_06485 [Flavobacteriales bacterium]